MQSDRSGTGYLGGEEVIFCGGCVGCVGVVGFGGWAGYFWSGGVRLGPAA